MIVAMCLLMAMISADAADDIDRLMASINRETHQSLAGLARSSAYSVLRTESLGVHAPLERCGLLSCMVGRQSIFGEECINLLEVGEGYTGYSAGSADVWRRMAEIAQDDPLVSAVLSGVHYSVSTHISAFYKRLLGMHLPNPRLFMKRYRNLYRMNFYLTYILVRESLGRISPGDSDAGLEGIAASIRDSRFRWDIHAEGLDESVRRVEEILVLMDNLKCERCVLWGKIQFKGLRAALKILGGEAAADERLFLVNLFMRLSTSVVENIRLREYRMPRLMLVPLFWMEILVLAIATAGIFLVSRLRGRTRKMHVD